MRRWEDGARDTVRAVLTAATAAVSPQVLVRTHVRRIEGGVEVRGTPVRLGPGACRLAALGKAARGLAVHAQAWGPWEERVLVGPPGTPPVEGFETLEGAHPFPDGRSVRAGERLEALAAATGPDDVLVLLVSGGASAMAEVPAVPLRDLQDVSQALLAQGADVREMAVVRKHLSRIKGGRLVALARGRVVSIVLSDVAGDDLAVVGGGPGVAGPSTYEDALDVLRARHVLEAAPPSVVEALEAGASGRVDGAQKELPNARAILLGGNGDAIDAAHEASRARGLPVVRAPALGGEARVCGRAFAEVALAVHETQGAAVVVAGGETTVTVRGAGRGGRNQELVLGAVERVAGRKVALASIGTDGVDGPTDAAGAIADGRSLARAHALGLSPAEALLENDAYPFFDALDDLVRTGPTGTNVADVAVGVVGER
ncbi:MAG TPA: DUF4147 domain-containing protein [Candidatus Thermoplasmatota archaeon]|nr:DUF4147 domain-containing protein [Candidatus Thermoplasmatota archaeon]